VFARKLVYRRPGRDNESEILNEVRAIEKLSKSGSHKHIVTVLNHGWLPNASYYSFDMEFCDFDLEYYLLGHTISRPSDQLRPNPYAPYQPLQTAQILEQITNAIAFIHSKGEVHRDLKPRNGIVHFLGFITISVIFIERRGLENHRFWPDGTGRIAKSQYNRLCPRYVRLPRPGDDSGGTSNFYEQGRYMGVRLHVV
jgi:serine/threonine protein kinase